MKKLVFFGFIILTFLNFNGFSQVAINEADNPNGLLVVTSGTDTLLGVKDDRIISYGAFELRNRTSYPQLTITNGIVRPQNNTLSLVTNSLERIRFLSDGKIGIGTASPTGDIEIATAGSYLYESTDLRICLYSDGASASPRITFVRSHSPVLGDVTSAAAVSQDGDNLGRVSFGGMRVNGEGSSSSGAGWLEMMQKGAATSNGVPGQFQVTTANSAGNRDTRMVVSPDGNVGIGTTEPSARLDVEGDVDLNGHEIKNFRIECRTSDPSNPAVGQIWIRTDL
jgi:hypothetical protein